MIFGAHVIIYSKDAAADRAFFRDVLGYPSVDAGHDWLMGVLMGGIWFVATIPYGMGAYYLGRLGTSVGWAVYMAFTLLVANIFGFMTGEWKGASTRSRRTLFAGLSVLVAAIVVLAIGNSMTRY